MTLFVLVLVLGLGLVLILLTRAGIKGTWRITRTVLRRAGLYMEQATLSCCADQMSKY